MDCMQIIKSVATFKSCNDNYVANGCYDFVTLIIVCCRRLFRDGTCAGGASHMISFSSGYWRHIVHDIVWRRLLCFSSWYIFITLVIAWAIRGWGELPWVYMSYISFMQLIIFRLMVFLSIHALVQMIRSHNTFENEIIFVSTMFMVLMVDPFMDHCYSSCYWHLLLPI